MFQALRERRALKQWQKSELGQALRHHGHDFFWKDDAPFGYLDEEEKQKACVELHTKAINILSSPQPILAVREQLADHVLTFAQLMVAGMKEEDLEDRNYAGTPYISGKLRPHIRKIADHIDELGRQRFSDPDITDEEMADFCTARASFLLFYCNGLNMVSISVEDRANKRSEWFRAYVQAAMVAAEDGLRREIGLESLLPGSVDGLIYSSFTDYVINGEPDPFYSWTKVWPDYFLYGKGPQPK